MACKMQTHDHQGRHPKGTENASVGVMHFLPRSTDANLGSRSGVDSPP